MHATIVTEHGAVNRGIRWSGALGLVFSRDTLLSEQRRVQSEGRAARACAVITAGPRAPVRTEEPDYLSASGGGITVVSGRRPALSSAWQFKRTQTGRRPGNRSAAACRGSERGCRA